MRHAQRVVILACLAVGVGCGAQLAAKPTATYAENRCGGIPTTWHPKGAGGLEPISNQLWIRRSDVRWNRTRISVRMLRQYLVEARQMDPQPRLTIIFDHRVDCKTVWSIRRLLKNNSACAHGLCTEYSDTEPLKWPDRPGDP
jgi:hypothetical protein